MQQQQMQQQQEQAMRLVEQEQARLDQELELKGADIANDRYAIDSKTRVDLLKIKLGMLSEGSKDDSIEQAELQLATRAQKEVERSNRAEEAIKRTIANKPKSSN